MCEVEKAVITVYMLIHSHANFQPSSMCVSVCLRFLCPSCAFKLKAPTLQVLHKVVISNTFPETQRLSPREQKRDFLSFVESLYLIVVVITRKHS